MRIGVQLIGPRVSELGPLARAAEDAGLDIAGLPGGGDYPRVTRLIHATERIRVATAIVPLFHATPYLHALSAMELQSLSGGRFVLGVGSQTKGQVRTQAGFDPPSPARMSRDMVLAIRALMAGERRYDGEFYKVDIPAIRFRSGGVDVTPPPIYFSGVNPLNLRIAGEVADGFLAHPIFTADYYRDTVWPRIEEGLARSGRSRDDFEMCAMPMFWLVDDTTSREEAYSRGKRNLAMYFSTRAYSGFMQQHGWEREREAIRAVWAEAMERGSPIDPLAMERIVSEEMVDAACLVGTAEEIRQQAAERYEGIAETLLFYSFHDPYVHDDEEPLRAERNLYRLIDAYRGAAGA